MINIFSQRLKELRKENGYTQTQLAEILEVGRTNISNWENKVCVPDLDTIAKLAAIFHVKADYLLGSVSRHSVSELKNIGLDLSKLNAAGVDSLMSFYKLLLFDKKYTV